MTDNMLDVKHKLWVVFCQLDEMRSRTALSSFQMERNQYACGVHVDPTE